MLDRFNFHKKNDSVVVVSPDANIYDQDNDIVLTIEMPGVDKGSLDVSLDGNLLYLKGQKKKEEVAKEYSLIHQERQEVEYQRIFELNTGVDRDRVRAEYTEGVLKVFLAKVQKDKPMIMG